MDTALIAKSFERHRKQRNNAIPETFPLRNILIFRIFEGLIPIGDPAESSVRSPTPHLYKRSGTGFIANRTPRETKNGSERRYFPNINSGNRSPNAISALMCRKK
ncbi:hypothetical protein FUAX_35430 [Fulvitalea axinellae]|uniref:Uncharacterized protein n=1 Tax=Fulvitalea axinellae TaxID=1182444 RepID=A0AAU9DD58_9BACT|nr:hypothetical protein FUAX_35430 [Fulvitalea axinellae]